MERGVGSRADATGTGVVMQEKGGATLGVKSSSEERRNL